MFTSCNLYFAFNFMNLVEPIRDRKKIAQIKNILRGQGRIRDLFLFLVGINTALRISDLLQLRIGDFLDDQGRIKRLFWIKEKKLHRPILSSSLSEKTGKPMESQESVLDIL